MLAVYERRFVSPIIIGERLAVELMVLLQEATAESPVFAVLDALMPFATTLAVPTQDEEREFIP